MEIFQQVMKRHTKYILNLLAIFFLGVAFTQYQEVFSGLILGTITSFINMWIAHRKIDKFGRAIIAGKKVRSLGMLLRMSMVAISVFIFFQYPELFHLGSLVFGLMTPYIVIMIDMFFHMLILRKRGE